jgi:hypothetical protein
MQNNNGVKQRFENGRSRSNSRQLSEILFLMKLKHYKERKMTF